MKRLNLSKYKHKPKYWEESDWDEFYSGKIIKNGKWVSSDWDDIDDKTVTKSMSNIIIKFNFRDERDAKFDATILYEYLDKEYGGFTFEVIGK